MSTRALVLEQIEIVAEEQKRKLLPLTDDLLLLESGLDSLSFAILVARLEDQFGVDPFSGAGEIKFPRTVGDLVKLYDSIHA
jgi:acyl carrier protein